MVGWIVAWAGQDRALVVRADLPGDTTEAVVHLASQGGLRDVGLRDDGRPPDPRAGDGAWTGSAFIGNSAVHVSLTTNAGELSGETVVWPTGEGALELALSVDGGAVKSTPRLLTAGVDAPGSAPGAGGGAPRGAGDIERPPAGGEVAAPAAVPRAGGPDRPEGYLCVGSAAALALVALGGLALSRRAAPSKRPLPLPEAGLLGEGTPSPNGPASAWQVDPVHAALLADQLLATLARHRPVVLSAGPDYVPGAVPGGPVYRAPGPRPAAAFVLVEEMLAQGPAAALFVGIDPGAFAALERARPEGGGALALVTGEVAGAVRCTRADGRWTFEHGGVVVHARGGPDGLHVERP